MRVLVMSFFVLMLALALLCVPPGDCVSLRKLRIGTTHELDVGAAAEAEAEAGAAAQTPGKEKWIAAMRAAMSSKDITFMPSVLSRAVCTTSYHTSSLIKQNAPMCAAYATTPLDKLSSAQPSAQFWSSSSIMERIFVQNKPILTDKDMSVMELRIKQLPEQVIVYHTVNEQGLKLIQASNKIKRAVVDIQLGGKSLEELEQYKGVWVHLLDPSVSVDKSAVHGPQDFEGIELPGVYTRVDQVLELCYGVFWKTRRDSGYGQHTIAMRFKKTQFSAKQPQEKERKLMFVAPAHKEPETIPLSEAINVAKIYLDDDLDFAKWQDYGMDTPPEFWINNEPPRDSKIKPRK